MPVATKTTTHFNQAGAPAAAFTVGTQVGVPTGTSLTTVSGSLPTEDATESFALTHPISGAQANPTCKVWRRRKFTGGPAIQATGGPYLFDECSFEVSNTNWAVDLGSTGASANQMAPLYIFRRCTFLGGDTTSRVLSGSYAWLMDCHITGGSDGWQGAVWSVAERCNIVATTDTRDADPHSDGIQLTDTGGITLYRCWVSAGTTVGQNAAVRVGSESGAVGNAIEVYYCGLDHGGYTVQFDGSKAGGAITGPAKFRGNRWSDSSWFYGPTDFVSTTISEWVDNKTFGGSTVAQP